MRPRPATPTSPSRSVARTACTTRRTRRRSPDAEYDQLFRRLVALEAAFPALVTPDSPTQKVGGTPAGGRFPEVHHRRPMLSLSNAFSHDELRAFDTRVRRGLGLAAAPEPADELTYVAELKIDGLAISLQYERGRFAVGATRGRREHRRGRDAQPAHDPGDPGPPARARHARGAGRGVHAQGGVRADQRRARGAGAAPVREPAQQRRGLAAPEGPGRDRRTPAVDVAVPAGGGRGGRRQPERGARSPRRPRLPRQPRSRGRASTSRA